MSSQALNKQESIKEGPNSCLIPFERLHILLYYRLNCELKWRDMCDRLIRKRIFTITIKMRAKNLRKWTKRRLQPQFG